MHMMSIVMIVPFVTSNPWGGSLGFRPIRVTVIFIHQSWFTAQQIISLSYGFRVLPYFNYRLVYLQRNCVLRLVSAVAINLGRDGVEPFLIDILRPIHRELEVPSSFKGIFGFAQFFFSWFCSTVGRRLHRQSIETLCGRSQVRSPDEPALGSKYLIMGN